MYDVKIYFNDNIKAKPKFTLRVDSKKQFDEIVEIIKNESIWLNYGPICCRKELIKYVVCEENDSNTSIKK